MNREYCRLLIFLFAIAAAQTSAAALQSPSDQSWGGWNRFDDGSLYVHWAQFDSYVPVGFPVALPDQSPDVAAHGLLSDTGAVIIPNNPGAFVTGSGLGGNIYSFGDTNDFDVIIRPSALITIEPVNLAVQVITAGTILDPNLVLLNGVSWTSHTVLETIPLGGDFGGDLQTEIYIWESFTRPTAETPFVIALIAEGTSNSLDQLLIDVGPVPVLATPLPGAFWLMLSAAVGLRRFLTIRLQPG